MRLDHEIRKDIKTFEAHKWTFPLFFKLTLELLLDIRELLREKSNSS